MLEFSKLWRLQKPRTPPRSPPADPLRCDKLLYLPPEIWEQIASFLSSRSLCKLSTLNRTFHHLANANLYSDVAIDDLSDIPGPRWRTRVPLQNLQNPLTAAYVRRLRIRTDADLGVIPGNKLSGPFEAFSEEYPRQERLERKRHSRSVQRRSQDIHNATKFMYNVNSLHIVYDVFYSHSYMDTVWRNCSPTIVSLKLEFWEKGLEFLRDMDPRIECPNLRFLSVLHYPFAKRYDQGVRMSRIPLSHALSGLLRILPKGPGLLQALCMVNEGKGRQEDISIAPFVNPSCDTMTDLRLHRISPSDLGQIRWNPSVISFLSFRAQDLYLQKDQLLPKLRGCTTLHALRLVESTGISQDQLDRFYMDLLESLSSPGSAGTYHISPLRRLHLPVPIIQPSFLTRAAFCLPNLHTLTFDGISVEENRVLVLKAWFDRGSLPQFAHHLLTMSRFDKASASFRTRIAQGEIDQAEGDVVLDFFGSHAHLDLNCLYDGLLPFNTPV